MPMIFKAALWALTIFIIALLGAIGFLPEPVSSNLQRILPALAVAVLILPAWEQWCKRAST